MTTYRATPKRWEFGWELHIADETGNIAGVTQCETPGTAEQMVREYVSLQCDIEDMHSFGVELTKPLE